MGSVTSDTSESSVGPPITRQVLLKPKRILKTVADRTPSRPPSAVAIFSNLVSALYTEQVSAERSHVTFQVASTSSKSKPSLNGAAYALPTEILISIFQLVFETCVDWNMTSASYPKHTTVWLEDDPLSPSLFPYSLASVCARWFHILNSIAAYWTRQVVTIDAHATAIQTALQAARNLPLQLIVTRCPGVYIENDRDEHARVRAVFGLLRSHTYRTWSLVFDVRHNSLLPALWRDREDAQYPRMLALASGPADVPWLPEPRPASDSDGCNTSLRAHVLEGNTLGGHFLNVALMFGEQRNLWFCNVTFLTIRGHMTSSETGISLYHFLTTIQNCGSLKKLAVENVSFVNDVPSSHRFRLEIPNVYLRKIANGDALGCVVSQALGIRLKESVTLSNCPFDGFGKRSSFRPRISSTNLALESMNASPAAMQQIVCFWNGENLSLVDCSGVSSAFLRGPAQDMPPDLRRLRIIDCENASAECLIALVRSREIQSMIDVLFPDDAGDASCMALVELHVHGRGSSVDARQAAWLAEHVETFSWNTTTGDGTRYTWDTCARKLSVLPSTTHD